MERKSIMKKLFTILTAVLMLVCAASCGAQVDISAVPAGKVTAQETKPEADGGNGQGFSVESRLEESGEYTDNLGNTTRYSYSLPKIVCDSDYAGCVNKEIDDLYEKHILPQLDTMEDGNSIVTPSSRWQKSSYGGITSVVLMINSSWDSDYPFFWNFDPYGNEADNAAVLKAAGMAAEEFVNRAHDVLEQEVSFDREGKSDEILKSLDEDAEKTLSEQNINAEMPMAVLDDGSILFCAKVYSVAGAGYYYRLYELLPDGGYKKVKSLAPGDESYNIFLIEKESNVIFACPPTAAAGSTVTIETCDVCDGEVKIEVNGADDGEFKDACIYEFTMPDHDVTVTAWISTEGFPGS